MQQALINCQLTTYYHYRMCRQISSLTLILWAGLCFSSLGQSTISPKPESQALAKPSQPAEPNQLLGTWEIDLRPTPDAAPYLKEFVVTELVQGSMKGRFYDTSFTNGRINTDWGKVYFGFTTQDGSGSYYTSGYVSEGKLYGVTYSEGRGFVLPWFSVRKK